MEINIYTSKRSRIKSFNISFLITKEIRYDLIHQTMLWQINRSRNVIAHTKNINQIKGSTAKIYKQKGTGRARHGSRKMGQFKGGAVIFGPNKRINFGHKINKKLKKKALFYALSDKIISQSLKIFKNFELKTYKTKNFLTNFPDIGKLKLLFISCFFEEKFLLSSRNIYNVNVLLTKGINVYDIINNDLIFITENAMNKVIDKFNYE